MKLSHYTAEPVTELHPVGTHVHPRGDKPDGVWVSVDGDDDWPSWCAGENWGMDRLTYRHVVTLVDDAEILVIDNLAALKAFDAEYRDNSDPDLGGLGFTIRWTALAEQYQGIIIAPYQWPARLNMMWYYGWDCASGCIWDVSAIKSFDLDTSWTPPEPTVYDWEAEDSEQSEQ